MPKKINLNRLPNFEKRVTDVLRGYYPGFKKVDWKYSFESVDANTGRPQLIVLAWINGRNGSGTYPIHVDFTVRKGLGAKPLQTKRIQIARDYFYGSGDYVSVEVRETITITHRVINGQSVFHKRFDDYPSPNALYGERISMNEYIESRAIAVDQGVAEEKAPIPQPYSYVVERIKYEN